MPRDGTQQSIDVDGLVKDFGRIDAGDRADCGDYQNRHLSERGILFLPSAKLPSIHHRHQQIEDDQVRQRPRFLKMIERLQTVLRALYRIAFVLENIAERLKSALVVVDHEDAAFAVWPVAHWPRSIEFIRGSSTKKVEPVPTLLTTRILP